MPIQMWVTFLCVWTRTTPQSSTHASVSFYFRNGQSPMSRINMFAQTPNPYKSPPPRDQVLDTRKWPAGKKAAYRKRWTADADCLFAIERVSKRGSGQLISPPSMSLSFSFSFHAPCATSEICTLQNVLQNTKLHAWKR